MGRILAKFELRRGTSQPLIRAMGRAALYAEKNGKTAAIHYHYKPDKTKSSGMLSVEASPFKSADTFDTLIMEVTPDMMPGDPPEPTQDMIQQARETILRLYRRMYYRKYGEQQRNDPELAPAWRARRNEYNRRYRRKLAGLAEE